MLHAQVMSFSALGPMTWIDAGPWRLRVQANVEGADQVSLWRSGELVASCTTAGLPVGPVIERLHAAAHALHDVPADANAEADQPWLATHLTWLHGGDAATFMTHLREQLGLPATA